MHVWQYHGMKSIKWSMLRETIQLCNEHDYIICHKQNQ